MPVSFFVGVFLRRGLIHVLNHQAFSYDLCVSTFVSSVEPERGQYPVSLYTQACEFKVIPALQISVQMLLPAGSPPTFPKFGYLVHPTSY